MEFNYHSEYPITLRKTDQGVEGTWYFNNPKSIDRLHEELRALGKGEEVDVIRSALRGPDGKEYRTFDDLGFQDSSQIRRKTMALVPPKFQHLEVIEVKGPAHFEPLMNNVWGASGTLNVDFELPSPHDIDISVIHRIVFVDVVATQLFRMKPRAKNSDPIEWEEVNEIILPYDADVYREVQWTRATAHRTVS
jgi:hypothetical protein